MTNTVKIDFPKIDVPHTTIQNRAQIIDLTKDLGVRKGRNRILTQELYLLPDETGPDGQKVWGVVGDSLNRFRFVGNWSMENGSLGKNIESSFSTTDYFEVTVNGTGLNALIHADGANCNAVYSINGSAESANFIGNYSDILASQYLSSNMVVNVFKNYTKGLYTVKIRTSNASDTLRVYGIDVLNEQSDLSVSYGEVFYNNLLLKNPNDVLISTRSDFESGTLGINGGRVSLYLKPNGTIGKSINSVGTALYLSNTDHSNEEIVDVKTFREMGVNQSSDFSTLLSSPSDRKFTLDDNTTTLTCDDCRVTSVQNRDGLNPDVSGDTWCFSFTGTGLDLDMNVLGSNAVTLEQVYIDDVLVGTFDQSSLVAGLYIQKICSDLPYGTHNVRIVSASDFDSHVFSFIIYQTKTPDIPTNSVYLESYNIPADYIQNTTSSIDAISRGVIRCMPLREFLYTGTWANVLNIGFIGSNNIYTATASSTASLNFNGKGIELRCGLSTGSVLIEIDGSSDLSSYTVSNYGGGSINTSTGVYSSPSSYNSGFVINGLDDGEHNIKITNIDSTGFHIQCADIICDTHSHKKTKNNTYNIGSQSVSNSFMDNLDDDKYVNHNQTSGAAYDHTTNSTVAIPMPEMRTHIYIKKDISKVEVSFHASIRGDTSGHNYQVLLAVDGNFDEDLICQNQSEGTNSELSFSLSKILTMSKGYHYVSAYWKSSNGSLMGIYGHSKILNLKEI